MSLSDGADRLEADECADGEGYAQRSRASGPRWRSWLRRRGVYLAIAAGGVIFALVLFLVWPNPRGTGRVLTHPVVMGHRGVLYQQPENSLEGFDLAGKLGIGAIELDVFLTTDDVLVVVHGDKGQRQDPETGVSMWVDGFLGNMTHVELLPSAGPNPYVGDLSAAQVAQLRFKEDSHELVCPVTATAASKGIPTLSAVLASCKASGLLVTVELKGPNTAGPAFRMVQSLDMLPSVTFSSFYHSRILEVKKLCPTARTAALFPPLLPPNFVSLAQAALADEVDMHYSDCTGPRVAETHAAGLRAMAWCSGPRNMPSQENDLFYAPLVATGVDVLCVNRPDVLYALLTARTHVSSA